MFLPTDEQISNLIIEDIKILRKDIDAQLKDFDLLCTKLQEKMDDLREKIKKLKRSHSLFDCSSDRF